MVKAGLQIGKVPRLEFCYEYQLELFGEAYNHSIVAVIIRFLLIIAKLIVKAMCPVT